LQGLTFSKAASMIVLTVLLISVLPIGSAAAVQGLGDEYPKLKPLSFQFRFNLKKYRSS